MKNVIDESSFLDHLTSTHWFRENVDLYFSSDYRFKYDEIMNGFFDRNIVKKKDEKLFTTIKP
jgi:hypothetical protein